MSKINILFIGSFLSKIKGTKGIAEKLSDRLSDIYNIKLSSEKENLPLRLIDISITSLFSNYSIMHIDIYSGKALIYAKIASSIAKIRNKKVIMNLRGGKLSELHESDSNKLEFLRKADRIISPSIFLSQYFNTKDFNVHYLPNYIDNKYFSYKRDNIKPYSLLWVRAFNDIYQPELAVKILNELKDIYPDVHLTMIGPDKGFQKSTEELISKLNLQKNISIIGRVPNEELYKYYQTHQIYLNTTLYESFGSAVLEAASCGIPIVSTNVGELPYIWEKKKEILFCNSDEKEFKNCIKMIFDSPDIETSLSINARKKAELFDWENVKENWKRSIESVI